MWLLSSKSVWRTDNLVGYCKVAFCGRCFFCDKINPVKIVGKPQVGTSYFERNSIYSAKTENSLNVLQCSFGPKVIAIACKN